jgi:hypothetical protein
MEVSGAVTSGHQAAVGVFICALVCYDMIRKQFVKRKSYRAQYLVIIVSTIGTWVHPRRTDIH